MADLGKVVVTDGGNYSASVTYEKLTFVHYQGDAYMTLKTVKGVTPTDDGTNYKLFCKSAELATATKAGIVLPDGTTTTVDGNGKISVKKATTSAAGIVKPAATDFIMAADGTQKINTQFTQATELANIIAGEAIAQVWGKVSKAIATTMNLDQNTLLKNMISNIAVNDPDKLNSAAYIYTLVERIGMGTELAVGANLTDGLNKVNSDLTESKNEVLLYSGKIKYNDEISVPNLHKYKLFHLGDNQNELYGCDVGGVVGNVLEFNLSGQVSGRAVFSSIKFHIIKANTLKVIFNIQVNVTADNAIEYVSLERESQITLWGVPLI